MKFSREEVQFKYGFTEGYPGCEAIIKQQKRNGKLISRNHNEKCRKIIEEEMETE